ncbi:MAG: hypothetical protein KDM81_07055, partial [Verrucomicrobiae bacterium]|nr:hypothetical protein [Verrucomicrobiae bacterium]
DLPNRSMTRVGGLIAAVQKGISKKSQRPYALITLEDREGTIQVLCLDDNFDKFAALLEPKKAVLVTGETNLGDDRPKIFPVDIMALDEAPARFTKQLHLRLTRAHLGRERLEHLAGLLQANPGPCSVTLILRTDEGAAVFMEPGSGFRVTPSIQLERSIEELLGTGAYLPKLDDELPEPPKRRARRRPESSAG